MRASTQTVLVAACGNEMAADDAFGPLVARRLRSMRLPHVDIVNLGMKPVALLEHLGNRQGVIIVDAAGPVVGLPECSFIDVDFFSPRRPPLRYDAWLSSHGLSIAHELELAKQLQLLPIRTHLLAATVSHTDLGSPISDAVLDLVEPAADRARELARQWLAHAGESAPE